MKIIAMLAGATLATGLTLTAHAQTPAAPMIRNGEQLTFSVTSSRFGSMGNATMRVSADTVNGKPAILLSFNYSTRVVLFRVSDTTRSWLDPASLTTLRYQKRERSPIGRRSEDARINTADNTWLTAKGTFPLASAAPLDELAFIYYVRAVAADIARAPVTMERHFDPARNPIRLESIGEVRVGALKDSLPAIAIQMDAKDSRAQKGSTRITFYIGRDAAHLPLRIVSSSPVAGTITMTLTSVTIVPQTVARTIVGDATTAAAQYATGNSDNRRQK